MVGDVEKMILVGLVWGVTNSLMRKASATFFAILSDTPISVAVPVTNATTFAATAVSGMLLGEKTHLVSI
ncbi:putative transmembrane family 234 [Dillenia turbinata]|uniref:Transmembrane family 234 n=1 Tax=Dillenia turbinata TaxID=194707 RepID=A0AAN8VX64_9MAGN